MIARTYIVKGRVQGVGFRYFVQATAQALGVAGWVRNNVDGSVEVLAAGTEAQLSALHAKLRSGPRAARVEAVDVLPAQPPRDANTFRIEGTW
jgi:acylphosphatase